MYPREDAWDRQEHRSIEQRLPPLSRRPQFSSGRQSLHPTTIGRAKEEAPRQQAPQSQEQDGYLRQVLENEAQRQLLFPQFGGHSIFEPELEINVIEPEQQQPPKLQLPQQRVPVGRQPLVSGGQSRSMQQAPQEQFISATSILAWEKAVEKRIGAIEKRTDNMFGQLCKHLEMVSTVSRKLDNVTTNTAIIRGIVDGLREQVSKIEESAAAKVDGAAEQQQQRGGNPDVNSAQFLYRDPGIQKAATPAVYLPIYSMLDELVPCNGDQYTFTRGQLNATFSLWWSKIASQYLNKSLSVSQTAIVIQEPAADEEPSVQHIRIVDEGQVLLVDEAGQVAEMDGGGDVPVGSGQGDGSDGRSDPSHPRSNDS